MCTSDVAELGSRYEIIVAGSVPVTAVLEPAVSVTLVVGKCNTGWVLLTAGNTLIQVLVLGAETGDVTSAEVNVFS